MSGRSYVVDRPITIDLNRSFLLNRGNVVVLMYPWAIMCGSKLFAYRILHRLFIPLAKFVVHIRLRPRLGDITFRTVVVDSWAIKLDQRFLMFLFSRTLINGHFYRGSPDLFQQWAINTIVCKRCSICKKMETIVSNISLRVFGFSSKFSVASFYNTLKKRAN